MVRRAVTRHCAPATSRRARWARPPATLTKRRRPRRTNACLSRNRQQHPGRPRVRIRLAPSARRSGEIRDQRTSSDQRTDQKSWINYQDQIIRSESNPKSESAMVEQLRDQANRSESEQSQIDKSEIKAQFRDSIRNRIS